MEKNWKIEQLKKKKRILEWYGGREDTPIKKGIGWIIYFG